MDENTRLILWMLHKNTRGNGAAWNTRHLGKLKLDGKAKKKQTHKKKGCWHG